jgi:hypothetical protein
MIDVDRLGDGVEGEVVDALPGADVDTALTEDALGLIDMEELLGPQLVGEVVALDHRKLVVVPDRRGLVDYATRHQESPLIRGLP